MGHITKYLRSKNPLGALILNDMWNYPIHTFLIDAYHLEHKGTKFF